MKMPYGFRRKKAGIKQRLFTVGKYFFHGKITREFS